MDPRTHAAPSRARPGALLALLALGALAGGCSPADQQPPRRAILIVLDAARADRFSCYGYGRPTTPNIDRLASRGMVYLAHYANGVSTRTSIPSLFFSRYFAKPVFPFDDHVPVYKPSELFRAQDPQAISLPRALQAGGMHTAGISAHQWFREDTELAREFAEFHDLPRRIPFDESHGYPRAEETIDYALRWLEAAGPDRDAFLYLHLMDTHFPHFPGEDAAAFLGSTPYAGGRVGEGGWPDDLATALEGPDREYMDALYDGSLRYVDRHLGRLFDFLERRGELDTTLIAITADHGEELLHRPHYFQHGSWEEAVARVPMVLFYPPRVGPGTTEVLSQGVDVHPTFLELLDVPLPPGKEVDGLALTQGLDGSGREHVFAWCGMRSRDFKLVGNLSEALEEPGRVPPHQLFDLRVDPGAQHDVALGRPEVVRSLFETYLERMRPAHERYLATSEDRTPEGPFALRPHDLQAEGVPRVAHSDAPRWWEDAESPSGWVRNVDARERSCLLAKEGAGPLEIRQALPSGEYDLELVVRGRCRIEAPGLEGAREVAGPPLGAERVGSARVEVGRVRVEDGMFRAVLHPDTAEGPFRLDLLGFTPAGYVPPDAEDEERRRQALRGLGYVE